MLTQLLVPVLLYATLETLSGIGNSVVPFQESLFQFSVQWHFEAAMFVHRDCLNIYTRKASNVIMRFKNVVKPLACLIPSNKYVHCAIIIHGRNLYDLLIPYIHRNEEFSKHHINISFQENLTTSQWLLPNLKTLFRLFFK